MIISEALRVLRALDALPEPRRRYLCALAADAPTDAQRARIVLEARHECRTVRENLSAALSADLDARRDWAMRNPRGPSEPPQGPSKRGMRSAAEEGTTHPGPRPISVRYVTPTKAMTERHKQARRKLNEPVRHHGSLPAEKPITHGTSSGYRSGCRCDSCREWKAQSRKKKGVRRPNGEPAPHGTTTNYSRGCRCQECRDAVAAHARRKYAEKKSGKSTK